MATTIEAIRDGRCFFSLDYRDFLAFNVVILCKVFLAFLQYSFRGSNLYENLSALWYRKLIVVETPQIINFTVFFLIKYNLQQRKTLKLTNKEKWFNVSMFQ